MITILFLTACVNPKGMTYTKLSNPEIRLQQYKDALDWYLENTTMKSCWLRILAMTSLIAIKSKSEKEGLNLFASMEMIMIEDEVRGMARLQ